MTRTLRALGGVLTLVLLLSLAGVGLYNGIEPGLAALKWLETFVDEHYWLSVTGFVVTLTVLVVLAAPVGTLFSLVGGYLFGVTTGTASALLGATLGGSLTFLMTRQFAAAPVRETLASGRTGRWLRKLENDPAWTLVMIRIIPFAPYFPINAAAGLTQIRLAKFAGWTALGLLPTTLIYALIGDGLGSVREAGALLEGNLWQKPKVWAALALLLALGAFGWVWHRQQLSD